MPGSQITDIGGVRPRPEVQHLYEDTLDELRNNNEALQRERRNQLSRERYKRKQSAMTPQQREEIRIKRRRRYLENKEKLLQEYARNTNAEQQDQEQVDAFRAALAQRTRIQRENRRDIPISDKRESDKRSFLKKIKVGPTQVCDSCLKFEYPHNGILVKGGSNMTDACTGKEGDVWLCNKCKSSIARGQHPKLSQMNCLQPVPIPDALKNLTTMEQRFISRVHSFLNIIVLPHGQLGLKGHSIHFPFDLSIVNELPNSPEVIVVNENNQIQQYSIRRDKIHMAVRCLKEINPFYQNINIQHTDITHSQPEPQEIPPEIPQNMPESVWTERDHVPPPQFTLPRNRNPPLSIFTDKNLETLTWPWLYPNGKNGFGEDRAQRVTEIEYFQSRILHSDGRWAACIPFLLWASSIVTKYQIQNCVNIALKMRSKGGNNHHRRMPTVTAKDVQDEATENPDITNNTYSFLHDIRGTGAYWSRVRSDLLTLLRTLGTPSFFITLSADDCNWTDLMGILLKQEGDNSDPGTLTPQRQRQLMLAHPVTVARHFNRRFHLLVSEVICGPGQPIGKVLDYFWRVEFQVGL